MLLKRYTILLFLLFCSSSILTGQGSAIWKTLGMVEKESVYDEAFGFYTDKVTVTELPKALQGTTLTVDGYIIPLTGKTSQSHFMLSLYPANMCFFCGAAGPETAMQVFMANAKKVEYTDNKIKVKGVLRINEHNSNGLLYTLEDAEIL